MEREIDNRHQGLSKRSAPMLFQIIGKFYRGAINHLEVIQERTREAELAVQDFQHTGDPKRLSAALTVLFWEYHFYVTCWLQIELALYRLAQQEETSVFRTIYEKYRPELERHLHVRQCIDRTEEAVRAQFAYFEEQMNRFLPKQFWFEGTAFGVDEASITALKNLYKDVMQYRKISNQHTS